MSATRPERMQEQPTRGMPRREFLRTSAVACSSAFLASRLGPAFEIARHAAAAATAAPDYPLAEPENIIYSTCLQCHTACPIKVKILDGVAVKIDGPAYSPQAMLPHMPYATSPRTAARVDGKVCPKGQAGVQSLYDPYRITKVLKRAGPRGSNRWMTIPFDKAIEEIVEGGYLFKHVPGEEKRHVPGLKELYGVRDPQLMSSLKADAAKVAKGEMTLEAFQEAHAEHLKLLVDPEHPDLGPVNNQFVFLAGRIEHGRKEFSKRWLKDGFGSVNWYEHTTICEQSHHIAYEQLTNQYKDGKWSGGKHHMKPDALHSEFIVYFGTGAFEANFGPPPMSEKVTSGIVEGRLKIAVVDPRFSKTAAKAWKWVPLRPGTDAALALGMIRWIIEHKRYDAAFLANGNRAAAAASEETSWTTASWLVKIEEDGRPGRYLRAADLGLGGKDAFVVWREGKPVAFDPYDETTPVRGELMVDRTIGEIRVKSVFQLLWESASSRTIEQWADLCGVGKETIEALAKEFTAHGKKAVAELYRGAVQHTNGYFNAQAIVTLNLLIGNPDWKGGLSAGGGHWHEAGDKPGQPYPLAKLHPGKLGSFGVPLTREKTHYEATTLFQGYPAPRNFYPFTSNVYQEVLPSARAKYPYRVKALFLHKGTPALSVPGAQPQIDALADLDAIPLLFACDIVIGESSMYADYLFPDLSIWERWGTPHVTPDVQTKTSKVRQPAVAPLTDTVRVGGETMPICMEAVMLAIAERLRLPGFGEDGFGPAMPLKRPEDFYLKMVANIAAGDKPGDAVPEADPEEMALFLAARRHLPPAVFDPERWKAAAGKAHWKRVVYVLNRGGRYEDFAKAYDGPRLAHRFGKLFPLYSEPVALARHAITGERFSGVPIYEPIRDAAGRLVETDPGFDLQMITYKDILGGQSRTLPANYWLSQILEENYVLMNSRDARRLRLRDGARVRVLSPTNPGTWDLRNGKQIPVEGKVKVIEGIRPGTVAISWHFGHWAYGAADVVVDGKAVPGDPRRRTGLCPNVVMMLDPYLKDVCLTDPIGGSASFYDTRIKVVPA